MRLGLIIRGFRGSGVQGFQDSRIHVSLNPRNPARGKSPTRSTLKLVSFRSRQAFDLNSRGGCRHLVTCGHAAGKRIVEKGIPRNIKLREGLLWRGLELGQGISGETGASNDCAEAGTSLRRARNLDVRRGSENVTFSGVL